ncbi:MAG: TrmH family RNA methyltransferase [Chloroflexota bacterium]
MPTTSYQIRLCTACGLRYPLTEGHAFGTRCPICMGDTRLILSRELILEPTPARHLTPDPSPKRRGELAVLLDNIRSAWNVGSIFRSADGFGFAHAYLCGITPTPDNEAVTKTSLGAEDSVTWSYHKDAVKLVKGLKKEGWRVFALEEGVKAKAIGSYGESRSKTGNKSVLIAGSEVTGVDPELLKLADEIFYIPMRGEKKSYNVAMAFSIAAYAISTKHTE